MQKKEFDFKERYSSLVNELRDIDLSNMNNLLKLKKIISPVNNIVTKALENSFIDWLYRKGLISENQYEQAIVDLKKRNPNAKGSDVNIEGDKDHKPIIAEIKVNVPVKKKEYGAKQLENIKTDIISLLDETKFKKESDKAKEYLKFMVLLKIDDKYQEGFNSENAINAILKLLDYKGDSIQLVAPDLTDKECFSPGNVYIIQLPLLVITEGDQSSQQ